MPVAESVMAIREDGCSGPEEYNKYLLVGRQQIEELLVAYEWCVLEGLVKEFLYPVEVLAVPESISCPDIAASDLRTYARMMVKEDIVRLGQALLLCEDNYKIREDRRIQESQPKFEVHR